MNSQAKKVLWTWALALVVAMTWYWAFKNGHKTLEFVLFLPAVVLVLVARMVTWGDAAFADKCPHCRGKVKAKATACQKCGRTVRASARV